MDIFRPPASNTHCSPWLVPWIICVSLLMGCPEEPSNGLVEQELIHDGTPRSYQLFVPSGHAEDEHTPLLVVLHRFTETGEVMAKVTGYNEIADREGFIVAYPDGLLRSFNAFDDERVDDVGFVVRVVEHIAETYKVDRSRVYLTGASNGGFMVHRIACETDGIFAGYAAVMSSISRDIAADCTSAFRVPMLIMHGTEDEVIPLDGAEVNYGPGNPVEVLSVLDTIAFWVAKNRASTPPLRTLMPERDPSDPTRVVLEEYAPLADGTPVHAYFVLGGGHAWPGGEKGTLPFLEGTVSNEIDASEVIWEFLAAHRLPLE